MFGFTMSAHYTCIYSIYKLNKFETVLSISYLEEHKLLDDKYKRVLNWKNNMYLPQENFFRA